MKNKCRFLRRFKWSDDFIGANTLFSFFFHLFSINLPLFLMEQLQFEYDYSTELLMRRLADASQRKIYPAVIPKTEIPLRKILLTTR
jgi:hypothetical protein